MFLCEDFFFFTEKVLKKIQNIVSLINCCIKIKMYFYTLAVFSFRILLHVLFFFQDTLPDFQNRTLIIDNGGQSVTPNPSATTPEMLSGYSSSVYAADPGRTWIVDNNTGSFEILQLTGSAHLALHPDLVR